MSKDKKDQTITPTVDRANSPTGSWKRAGNDHLVECAHCGFGSIWAYFGKYRYCPQCGYDNTPKNDSEAKALWRA